jgi:hypothetical protein
MRISMLKSEVMDGKDVPFKSVHYSDQSLINIVSIFHNLLF